MSQSRGVVSAHIVVFINGLVYGQVVDLRWETSTPQISRSGVDSLTAFELSPGPVMVRGNMSILKLHSDGGLEGRGIVAPFSHISREKYFSILVVNRVTGQKLHQADKCKVTSQSWSYGARGKPQGTFTFEGIDCLAEVAYD